MSTSHTVGRGRMAAEIALAVCTDSELSVQVGGTTPPNQDRLIEYVTRLVQGVLDGMGLGLGGESTSKEREHSDQ